VQDFVLNGNEIQVKSAKWFSRWLLLETKDILRGETYDYYILVTVSEDYKSATIRGFATKNEILSDSNTLKLKKGELIPGTKTILDADNHARHEKFLHKSVEEWKELIQAKIAKIEVSKLSQYFLLFSL
jgi:hypothetical protein